MKVTPTTVIEGQRLREQAKKFNPALESAPVAVLWTDERREWEGVPPQLQSALPELFALGAYLPRCQVAAAAGGGTSAAVRVV